MIQHASTSGFRLRAVGCLVAAIAAMLTWSSPARAGFIIGPDASSYAVLFEGAGGNTLQITNVTVKGSVGVGMTGKVTAGGPATIQGRVDFSAVNTGQFANNNAGNVITGGVNYNVASVTSALNLVNSLNMTLGAESGTAVNIGTGSGQTLTINASSGILDANGNRVFTVTGFNTTNGDILTIKGDAAGDSVVLNFTSSVNFNNQVALSGLSQDKVLYNFVGGSNLTGGPTLQINDNASSSSTNIVQGIFLDPNGAISVTNANLVGRVFGGDTHDFQYVSGSNLNSPAAVPEPAGLLLGGTGAVFMLAMVCRRRKRVARQMSA